MPVSYVVDKSGRGIHLVPFQEIFISPQFNENAVNNMGDFPLRTDDVILVSYPKSGCHWGWEILRILVSGKIVDDSLSKEDFMMEWTPAHEMKSLPSPRILNNHLPFHMQPRDLLTKKLKVVLLYRNFKDVAVSFFHHHVAIKEYEYKGDDFGSYLQRLLDGQVESGNPFNFTKGWEKGMRDNPDLPVYCLAYEEMRQNPMSEMRRLCDFLGRDHDDSFLQQACDVTSFDYMKKTKGVVRPLFYRKGQVGDWKNMFTVTLNEWFDDIIQAEMADTRLKFRYQP